MEAIDLLALADSASCNLKYVALEDTLYTFDGVSSNRVSISVLDPLHLLDTIKLIKNANLVVQDTLSLVDYAIPRTVHGDVSDRLDFVDTASKRDRLTDHLIISDTVSGSVGLGIVDQFNLSDSAVFGIYRAANAYDLLEFEDLCNNLDREVVIRQQTIVEGFAITGVPADFAAGVIEPYVAPWIGMNNNLGNLRANVGTILLPLPKFGNVKTTSLKRINRKSRGNDLIVTSIKDWVHTFLIRFEWDYLKKEDFFRLQEFVRLSLGRVVTVDMIYGSSATVIFLKPETEFIQLGRENYQVALDMQILSSKEPVF